MKPKPSDADLVASYLRRGAPADFEILVHRHREKTLRLVLSVLGPEYQGDAEDVVQRVFLRAHDRLDRFRGSSLFSTWLYRIAYNLAIDTKRTLERRRRLLHDRPPGTGAPAPEPDRPDLDTEHAYSVRKALLELPEPYQTALRLHYWLDLPVQDIAELLGVAVGTAKSYLHRGRKRLHPLLQAKELSP